jgi:hypothetical protein
LLGGTTKVMLDADSGNLMYLPLDKMMGQSLNSTDNAKSNFTELSLPKSSVPASTGRSSNRSVSREAR